MKIICTQENLKNGIGVVSRIVNQSLSLPILGNLFLETRDGVLVAQSTNLEQAARTSIRCKMEAEGKVCVPAKLFTDLVNNLPNQNTTLEVIGKDLVITCGKFKNKLKTLPTDDFPTMPELDGPSGFTVNNKEFAKSIQQVSFATSTSESQPEISGVLFKLSTGKLVLAATDRFRLAEKTLHVDYDGPEVLMIVPKKTVEEFSRLATTQNGELLVYFGDNQIALKSGETVLMSRVIDGQYPEYEHIIPTHHEARASVSREKFLSAIKAVSVFCGNSNTIKVLFSKENQEVTLASLNQEFGDSEVGVEGVVEGESLEVLFNYRYLSDVFNSQESGEIEVLLISSVMSVVFTPFGGENFRYLVMPIKN